MARNATQKVGGHRTQEQINFRSNYKETYDRLHNEAKSEIPIGNVATFETQSKCFSQLPENYEIDVAVGDDILKCLRMYDFDSITMAQTLEMSDPDQLFSETETDGDDSDCGAGSDSDASIVSEISGVQSDAED